jgi:hypothetical protein
MKTKGLHSADVAEIQEAVTDELKKVRKEEFSAAFQKLYDHTYHVYKLKKLNFNFKKGVRLQLSSI